MRRSLPVFIAVIASLAAVLSFGAAPAAAKVPCWKTLLNDWEIDGRVDGTYAPHCYTQAISHLQVDVSMYGSAAQDIRRALASAVIAYKKDHGGRPPGPNTPVKGAGGKGGGGHKRHGFITWIADRLGPGNATSIPLPLLILAGVGLLLVLAAAASYAARKIQARRMRPQPATSPPTPPRK
jgi:hypothetical protein